MTREALTLETERTRGADLLVRSLLGHGIDTAFSLSGNHIMPIYDAAFEQPLRLVHTRHEAAAVHMADAWARLSGKVGVAIVSAGQGHANAVGALCTALAGETPLLLLSGHAPLFELGMGSFQEQDQAALAAPTAKASWVVRSAGDIVQEVERALALACEGRPGPVHLSLPSDVLEARVTRQGLRAAPAITPSATTLSKSDCARVMAAVSIANRPIIIAPPALGTTVGRKALACLQDAMGIPAVVMESPRGPNDPAQGALFEVLAECDLVVLLGKALDFTLRFGGAPFDVAAHWVVVEPDPALQERARRVLGERATVMAGAAPLAAVRALSNAAGLKPLFAWQEWNARARSMLAFEPAAWNSVSDDSPNGLHPVTIGRTVHRFINEHGGVFIADGGEFAQWSQALVRAPERIINGPAGAIGPSVPFAIGASAARPGKPVVAMLGDGTFGYHMAEFETAVRVGLPFIAVIGNDARWNAEHQIQCRDYGPSRAHGCTLPADIRYDQAVVALGGYGEFVTEASELPAALQRAWASGRAACINVRMQSHPAPTIRAT